VTPTEVAARLAALVLRLSPHPEPPDDPRAAGWITLPGALTHAATVLGAEAVPAVAFGRPTGAILTERHLVAPGLAVAVPDDGEAEGPDAIYSREDESVRREAGGSQTVALRLGATLESLDPVGAELVWFGPAERWLYAAGRLCVEDLFSTLAMPCDTALLEKLVVRGRRTEAAVAVGFGMAATGDAEMAVRRDVDLVPVEIFRDPASWWHHRADLERPRAEGDRVSLDSAWGGTLELSVALDADGWTLTRLSGRHPFVRVALSREDGAVVLRGVLDPGIDPLAPGMRGRLAFDLHADLVALQKS
jgi:hypothetical protein